MRANPPSFFVNTLILVGCLSGCQSDKISVDSLLPKPAVHVDPSALQECNGVVDIPHRFLPSAEHADLHAIDRQSLGSCKRANHAKILIIKALVK